MRIHYFPTKKNNKTKQRNRQQNTINEEDEGVASSSSSSSTLYDSYKKFYDNDNDEYSNDSDDDVDSKYFLRFSFSLFCTFVWTFLFSTLEKMVGKQRSSIIKEIWKKYMSMIGWEITEPSTTTDKELVLSLSSSSSPIIFDIFPDVDPLYVQRLLYENNNRTDDVLMILADSGPYPATTMPTSSQSTTMTRKKKDTDDNNDFDDIDVFNDGNVLPAPFLIKRAHAKPKYDYYSTTSSFEPTPEYIHGAIQQLRYDFPYIPKDVIKRTMKECNNRYSIVRKSFIDTIVGGEKYSKEDNKGEKSQEEYEIQRYYAVRKLLITCSLTIEQSKRFGTCNVLGKRRDGPKTSPEMTINDKDPILKDELFHCRRQTNEWMEQMEVLVERQTIRQRHRRTTSITSQMNNNDDNYENSSVMMECSCCFDSVPIYEMISCRDEGHLFCFSCIKRYAEIQIFSLGSLGIDKTTNQPSMQLLCCHNTGCQSVFDDEQLQRVLSKQTFQKYNELQFRTVIDQSGLRNDIWYVCLLFCLLCFVPPELYIRLPHATLFPPH